MEVDKNEPMEDDSDVDNETEENLLKEDDKEVMMDSDEYKEMVSFGIDEAVALQMMKMFSGGNLSYDDMDERAKIALKEFPSKDAIRLLQVLQKTTMEHVVNKSAYLCGQMRLFRLNRKAFTQKMTSYDPPGPDEKKLKEILDDSGYTLDITPGQRRYGGPPPGWEGNEPVGTELCVGRIPKNWFEDKLVPLFADIGRIYEMRIMIDTYTGYNRNFCFVRFCQKDDAEKAMRILNKYEVRAGKTLKANLSASNTRLFVGNIPKPKDKDEIMEEFSKSVEGIQEILISVNDEMATRDLKNKGYAFFEFGDHKTAATAKKKLENSKEPFFGNRVVVEWAEILEEPDDDQMATVKIVHVKNLSTEITEDTLRKTFEAHGKIHNVQKVRDYAFIHFDKREDALAAIEALNGTELGKYNIDVGLSKSNVVKQRRRENQKRMGIMGYRDKLGRNRGGGGGGDGMRGGRGGRGGGGMGRGGGGGMGRGGRGSNRGGGGGMMGRGGGMMGRGGIIGARNMGMNGMGMGNMGMMQNRNMGWGGDMGYQGGYDDFGFQGNRMGGGMGGGNFGMGGGGGNWGNQRMGMGMGGGMGGMGMGMGGAMGGGNMGFGGGMGGFNNRMGGGMDMNMKRKFGQGGDLGNKRRR